MAQTDPIKSLIEGTAPKNLRILAAKGLIPFPAKQMLVLLVALHKDADQEVAAQAIKTLNDWPENEILAQLKSSDCNLQVLEYFTLENTAEPLLEAIIANPATPASLIETLALKASPHLQELMLDNKVRIIEFPGIFKNIKQNPSTTAQIQRLIHEIEVEFFKGKQQEYAVESGEQPLIPEESEYLDFETEAPAGDLSIEGLPLEPGARNTALTRQLSAMSVKDKIRYALFGNREIRMMLVRDPLKQVSKMVLRSPKITEAEVESISAMTSVADEILREIGNSKDWARNYTVMHNLVKNPKTPPMISQRMLYRLQTKDLTLLARDRSVPEAIRVNAARALSQRNKPGR